MSFGTDIKKIISFLQNTKTIYIFNTDVTSMLDELST